MFGRMRLAAHVPEGATARGWPQGADFSWTCHRDDDKIGEGAQAPRSLRVAKQRVRRP